MEQIADGTGPRAWKYGVNSTLNLSPASDLGINNSTQLVETLDGMNRMFANPYIIFYPVVSRDGMPFPLNRSIREIQGRSFKKEVAWRGNIIAMKYHNNLFSSMMDASMADFPLLKNYLLMHGSPPWP